MLLISIKQRYSGGRALVSPRAISLAAATMARTMLA
jgi:hypothetical protein